jgi:predicted nucleic acid-binding protein
MRYCPDASVILAWLLADQRSDAVAAFWTGLTTADELVAPMLLLAECTSVLRKRAFGGALSHDDSIQLLGQMLELPIRVSNEPAQFLRAMEISNGTKRAKAYDMQYVAVAEAERAEIVTLDGGIRQAALELRLPVRLLR